MLNRVSSGRPTWLPRKVEIRKDCCVLAGSRIFLGKNKQNNISITFLFFRCGGAKKIAGKPQERGKVNISLRSRD